MLEKPIDVLSLLTEWQKGKLKNAGIYTIEDLHLKTEENLIESIYNVGPARARIMKNAAYCRIIGISIRIKCNKCVNQDVPYIALTQTLNGG